jgi:hypothetical protein
MRDNSISEHGFSKALSIVSLCVVGIVVAFYAFGGPIRRLIRESLMQRETSAHYEILYPAETLSPDALKQFTTQRESLLEQFDKKLGEAGSSARIHIVFDPAYSMAKSEQSGEEPYSVYGTTIRTKLGAQTPSLPPVADAEAVLFAAWGKPGNARIARWTSIWLTGEWRGSEIGMAAAEVEQKVGYKKLEIILSDSPGQIPSLEDQDLLGAAWISEVAEFGGTEAVRKIYAAKMSRPSLDEVTRVLGTSPLELERKWQMWSYAYLAGMPAMTPSSPMPMDMPMDTSH